MYRRRCLQELDRSLLALRVKHERIVSTRRALARFAAEAKGCLVVLEASGGYEWALTTALARAGTAYARKTLYLAAFIASRYDPKLKAFRQRLEAKGKPAKLAIIATARKLLTILNAMVKTGQNYRPEAP